MDTPAEKEVPRTEAPAETSAPSGAIPETITVSQETLKEHTSFFARNKMTIIASAVALALLLGAGYYFYLTKNGGTSIAVVNGMRIYQKDYDESIAIIEETASLQGLDLTDEATKADIQTQALETLINNALIITAAEAAGITATDADIQAKYDELATQMGGVEALTAQMANVGLSEEKLRKNIRERILADAYLEKETDIDTVAISDDEITAFYNSLIEGAPVDAQIPKLEEVRPQIESELTRQKQQQMVTELLAKLKTEADIKMKI